MSKILTQEEIQNRTLDGISLDAPLSAAEITARQAEKDKLLLAQQPALEPVTVAAVAVSSDETTSGMLARLAGAARGADAGVLAARRAEVEAIVAPLFTRAKATQTRYGMLKAKHQSRIAAVRNSDWPAVLRAAPNDYVMSGQRMVSPSRNAIHALRAAAEAATLSSTFGDSARDKNALDPTSLDDAVDLVRGYLGGEPIDPVTRTIAPYVERAISHLKWWLTKAEQITESAAEAVARFDAAEARLRDVLAGVPAAEVVPVVPGLRLAELPDAPPSGAPASSYQDFEVRSVMRAAPPPPSNIEVEPIGADDGKRARRIR